MTLSRAFASECSDCDEHSSMTRYRRSWRTHSFATNKPTGPAPTIHTSVSIGLLTLLRQKGTGGRAMRSWPGGPPNSRHSARCLRWKRRRAENTSPSKSTTKRRSGADGRGQQVRSSIIRLRRVADHDSLCVGRERCCCFAGRDIRRILTRRKLRIATCREAVCKPFA